jgi:hypothetical protein
MRQTTLQIAAFMAIGCQSRPLIERTAGFLTIFRGGAATDEDEFLDAYINQLIACVDEEDAAEEPEVETAAEDQPPIEEELKEKREKIEEGKDDQQDLSEDHRSHDSDKETWDEDADEVAKEKDQIDKFSAVLVDDLIVKDITVEAEVDTFEVDLSVNSYQVEPERKARMDKKGKKKLKPKPPETLTIPEENTQTESLSDFFADPAKEVSIPPRPPNAAIRFLLNQGRIGHIIAMICIWISEFTQAYLPPVATFSAWIVSLLFPARNEGPYVPPKNVNEQYAGFVSADGTSGRAKKTKLATKKADLKAVEQLRRIGSIKEAKYRHVSVNFLKRYVIFAQRQGNRSYVSHLFLNRHKIGQYSDSEGNRAMAQSGEFVSYSTSADKAKIDEDEDTSWVVEALTKQEPKKEKSKSLSSPIRTSVSLGSHGASIGVEFSIGGNSIKKAAKKRSSILEAATRTSSSKRRHVRPKASDREGGGGVMGRLRDLSTKNLMSRSLFGAYPGDAVPPSQAASADGVLTLARKYGYGDWSDDDSDDDMLVKRRKGTSSNSSSSPPTKRRKRRPSSTASPRRVSGSLDVHLDESPPTTGPASSHEKMSPPSMVKNSLDELIASNKKRDILVRPPMKRLREATSKLEETDY